MKLSVLNVELSYKLDDPISAETDNGEVFSSKQRGEYLLSALLKLKRIFLQYSNVEVYTKYFPNDLIQYSGETNIDLNDKHIVGVLYNGQLCNYIDPFKVEPDSYNILNKQINVYDSNSNNVAKKSIIYVIDLANEEFSILVKDLVMLLAVIEGSFDNNEFEKIQSYNSLFNSSIQILGINLQNDKLEDR